MKTGQLKTALEHADKLIGQDLLLAEEQALEILKSIPDEPNALRILGTIQRMAERFDDSSATLKKLTRRAPEFGLARQEYGLTLLALGKGEQALKEFRNAIVHDKTLARSWKALGDLLSVKGEETEAQQAYKNYLNCTAGDPALVLAANCLFAGKLAKCEKLCREYLLDHPTNVSAIRMLAEVGLKLGHLLDAENLIRRCLDLTPDFHLARNTYVQVLFKQQHYEAALVELEKLLIVEPNNPVHHVLKASILVRIGDYDQAIESYDWVLGRFPGQAKIHLSHGHALKTVGLQERAIAAYRRCIALQPQLGEAYWSLANLKIFEFDDDDIAAMKAETTAGEIDRQDFFHLCFALGKALEDEHQYDESFRYYRMGNKARRQTIKWDAGEHHARREILESFFTRHFFAEREGVGDLSRDPIFIVGLPRAGSTLLEQILASHSRVEGTMELPDIILMQVRLSGREKPEDPSLYPEVLNTLTASQFTDLGREYLERTRIQRAQGTPLFIDKMPNNFVHIGLIHLILPNAKIIDARRHPLGCCFSGYKQLFASGQNYTYSLEEIGRYYADYVALMDHWDKVLPNLVLRVHYEDVVSDTETQVRRILTYCDLPFEQACLDFHNTDRAVRTASSEQVRQPIYQSGTDQWHHFDDHLDLLKAALGPVLSSYPTTKTK